MSSTPLPTEAGDEVVVHDGPTISDTQTEMPQDLPDSKTLDERPVSSESFYAQREEAAPRRGGRVRKPTQKSTDAELSALVADDLGSAAPKDARNSKSADPETKDASAEVEQKKEEDDQEEVYCICRSGDDGSFMVSCERCEEWFHTRCIGLTQKEAKKLAEYVCESCAAKEKKAAKGSKGKATKKYQGSTKSKRAKQARDDSEVPSEPASSVHGGESDDGDDYKSDKTDQSEDEAIEVDEDGDDYQESTIRPRLSQADSSSRSAKRKDADESPSQSPRKSRILSSSDGKRRASGNVEASAANGRRPSSSQNKKASRKPSGPTDAATEDARSKARKVLADALVKILSPPAEGAVKKEEPTRAEEGTAYALELESTLFETNADLQGRAKVVGTKYKDRFRTMLFSLKDAKNTTLHARIASGELPAVDLAQMTSDELANDAMRQATEKARMEALHNSTLKSETAGPMRKITHKGEIEIESETAAPRDEPGKFQRTIRKEVPRFEDGDDVELVGSRTFESEPAPASHEDEPDTGDDTSISRHSAPAPTGPSQSPTAQLDFSSVWGVSEHQAVESDEDMVADDADHATGNSGGLDGADDFIDSFLDGKPENADAEELEKQATQRSTTPKGKPPAAAVHRYRQVIWNGLVDLPDEFAFQGHVKQIAGRSLAHKPAIWSSFLPSKTVGVAGRLPSKSAVEYLVQIGNSSKAEVVVFTLEPGQNTASTAETGESDLASFNGMMKYLKDADRWGALHVPAKVKGVLIKDLYLAPFYKDQEVPLWLDLAQADSLGAEWQKTRDRDMFLLVAVVVREALRRELSEGSAKRDRSVSSSLPAPGSQPIPVSAPATEAAVPAAAPASGFGSDALQTLLRTLGKNTPQSSNGTPPHTSLQSPPPFTGSLPPGPPPGPPPHIPAGNYAPHHQPYGMPPQHQFQHVPQQAWQPQHYPPAGPYGAPPAQNWHAGPPPQQMPEEEYPGQYNPDYINANQGGGHGASFHGRGQPFFNRGRGWRGRGW